jgi:hypothetical protein
LCGIRKKNRGYIERLNPAVTNQLKLNTSESFI